MNKRRKGKFLQRLVKLGLLCLSLSFLCVCFSEVFAMTRSIGYPFEGRLENGIPFPREFRGYQLRSIEHTYTTPEVIGALLDAIENVRQDFPDTCDIYLGDFSRPGGGPWYPVHKSHQNGRDVDIGMYAKNNQPLNNLVPMNEENFDLPKNWSLILHLLNSHLVERIFVDISLQRLLYNYALSQGYDKNFLDKIFQAGSGDYEYTFVRHEPNHRDHMHVRFVAPWSELAGRLDNPTPEQRRIIEIAQNSFLPKKVLYYAKDEASPEMLSAKLGIPVEDILRWNKLKRLDPIRPGMPIVFYKRGFDLESVQLALSLDAMLMRSRSGGELALLHNDVMLNIPSMRNIVPAFQARSTENKANDTTKNSVNDFPRQQQLPTRIQSVEKNKLPAPQLFHIVRPGDSLSSISKKYNLSVKELATLNKLTPKSSLFPGQKLVISTGKQNRATAVGLLAMNKNFSNVTSQQSNTVPAKAVKEVKKQPSNNSKVSNQKLPASAPNVSKSKQGRDNLVAKASTTKIASQQPSKNGAISKGVTPDVAKKTAPSAVAKVHQQQQQQAKKPVNKK